MITRTIWSSLGERDRDCARDLLMVRGGSSLRPERLDADEFEDQGVHIVHRGRLCSRSEWDWHERWFELLAAPSFGALHDGYIIATDSLLVGAVRAGPDPAPDFAVGFPAYLHPDFWARRVDGYDWPRGRGPLHGVAYGQPGSPGEFALSRVAGGLVAVVNPSRNGMLLDDAAIPATEACWQPKALTTNTNRTVLGFALHGRQLLAVTHDGDDRPLVVAASVLQPARWQVPLGWAYAILRGNAEVGSVPEYAQTQALWGYCEFVLDADHWPAVCAGDPQALDVFEQRLAQARANLQYPLV